MSSSGVRTLALALVVSWALAAPVAAVAGDAKVEPPCADHADFPGLGPACPSGHGYEVILADGSRIFTHGGDPAPPGEAPPAAPVPIGEFGIFSGVVPTDPACVTLPTEAHGHLLYVHAADRPSRVEAMRPILREWMRYVNGFLTRESAEFGLSLRYRMLCDAGGNLVVDHVIMPRPAAETTFQSIVSDLQALGYRNPYAKYWIWNDDLGIAARCGCGGWGDFIDEGRATPDNPNNRGPSYAVTHGWMTEWSPFTMMHENGHNLGAVTFAAKASSGRAHCNDGLDVMCYADGGPKSNYVSTVCSTYHFDCRHDTYFHPAPPAGTTLAGHWNLGLPTNRYIQGCHYATARLAGALNGLDVDRATAMTVSIPPSCAGRPFALFGEVLPGTSLMVDNFDVCWYAGATALRCDAATGMVEKGTVPAGANAARVLYRFGAGSAFTLSIQ